MAQTGAGENLANRRTRAKVQQWASRGGSKRPVKHGRKPNKQAELRKNQKEERGRKPNEHPVAAIGINLANEGAAEEGKTGENPTSADKGITRTSRIQYVGLAFCFLGRPERRVLFQSKL